MSFDKVIVCARPGGPSDNLPGITRTKCARCDVPIVISSQGLAKCEADPEIKLLCVRCAKEVSPDAMPTVPEYVRQHTAEFYELSRERVDELADGYEAQQLKELDDV